MYLILIFMSVKLTPEVSDLIEQLVKLSALAKTIKVAFRSNWFNSL